MGGNAQDYKTGTRGGHYDLTPAGGSPGRMTIRREGQGRLVGGMVGQGGETLRQLKEKTTLTPLALRGQRPMTQTKLTQFRLMTPRW